ncbi:MAG TPA: fibronectin type III domain-containing protein, partial [Geobacteraceae bacterium]
PIPAPTRLALTASATAIELRWDAPSLPADAKLLGYRLYRSRGNEPLPLQPLTAAPVTDTRYEDLQLERDVAYRYAVRSVVRLGDETTESQLSTEATGTLAPPE